jgi:hypothetical protein
MEPADLLALIDAHLEATGQAAATFGREATGDPKLVFNLRDGREPRRSTVQKILSYIGENPGAPASPRRPHTAPGTVRIQLDHRVTFDQAERIFAILNDAR